MDPPVFDLLIQSSTLDTTFGIPVTENGFMVNYRHQRFRGPWFDKASPPPVRFVTLDSLDGGTLREAWDTALQEGRETEAIDAVRLLHEDLESIVFLTSDTSRTGSGRAGVLLGFGGAGRRERVPLGSHGDGMHRLLALSLALVQAADGVPADRRDRHRAALDRAGGHAAAGRRHRAQVVGAGVRYDGQLRLHPGAASLVQSRPDLAGEVSIHNIGRSICNAVNLDADDIQVAVEQNIEVR